MPTLLYVPRFDENGAAPRYRIYQYLDSFKKLGFNITVKPLFNINYLNNLYFKKKRSIFYLIKTYFQRALFLTFNKSKFDIVLMDGELFPFIPYFFEKMFLPRHFIIDQDDAIFHTYDNHRSFLVRLLLGKKIKKVWRKSHHIIVGNDYIKKNAIAMGVKQVIALPTVVNAELYKPSITSRTKYKDEIIIGWVGSPTTIHSMDHIKQAIINVSKKANIILYIIGAKYNIPGVKIICIDWKDGWSELDEINLTNEIDIGIMPLVDGPYHKGKGGFKLIKYMACAKPMIASAVGVNTEIIDHGKNGYLTSSVEEWEKYLLILIENPEKRKQFGSAGREKMLAQYSFQVIDPIICNMVVESCNKMRSSDFRTFI